MNYTHPRNTCSQYAMIKQKIIIYNDTTFTENNLKSFHIISKIYLKSDKATTISSILLLNSLKLCQDYSLTDIKLFSLHLSSSNTSQLKKAALFSRFLYSYFVSCMSSTVAINVNQINHQGHPWYNTWPFALCMKYQDENTHQVSSRNPRPDRQKNGTAESLKAVSSR